MTKVFKLNFCSEWYFFISASKGVGGGEHLNYNHSCDIIWHLSGRSLILISRFLLFQKVQGIDGALQIATYLKSQGVQLEFLVDEGTVIVKDAVPGMRIPFALWVNCLNICHKVASPQQSYTPPPLHQPSPKKEKNARLPPMVYVILLKGFFSRFSCFAPSPKTNKFQFNQIIEE